MTCSLVVEQHVPDRAAGAPRQDAPRLGCDRIRLATRADIPALVENASRASSMKANPIPLTAEELSGILNCVLRNV